MGMSQLGVQEVDIVSIVKPIRNMLSPVSIRRHSLPFGRGRLSSFHGRPVRCGSNIPLDVQASPIELPSAVRGFDPAELTKPPADFFAEAEVARLLQKLNHAERPLLFAGNGYAWGHAEKEFEQLRMLLGIPTVATWCAAIWSRATILSIWPTRFGRGARGKLALQNSDFCLPSVPVWTSQSQDTRLKTWLVGAHKAVVDIDKAELKKLHPHVQQPSRPIAKNF